MLGHSVIELSSFWYMAGVVWGCFSLESPICLLTLPIQGSFENHPLMSFFSHLLVSL
ncbi:unnamed protein product [Arabidopsis halleri]